MSLVNNNRSGNKNRRQIRLQSQQNNIIDSVFTCNTGSQPHSYSFKHTRLSVYYAVFRPIFHGLLYWVSHIHTHTSRKTLILLPNQNKKKKKWNKMEYQVKQVSTGHDGWTPAAAVAAAATVREIDTTTTEQTDKTNSLAQFHMNYSCVKYLNFEDKPVQYLKEQFISVLLYL